MGDVVGYDPFKLIERLSGFRFLVDEAKAAGPDLRHPYDSRGRVAGSVGYQAQGVGGGLSRVQGQRDGNTALLECLLDPLHDDIVE